MLKIYKARLKSDWFRLALYSILFTVYTTFLIIDCFHHVPIIKIISSILWIAFIASYAVSFWFKPSKEINEPIDQLSFDKQWLDKQPLAILIKIIVLCLIAAIFILIMQNGEYGENYVYKNENYAKFYGGGNILLCLSLISSNIEEILNIEKTRLKDIVKLLVCLAGIIIMSFGYDYL